MKALTSGKRVVAAVHAAPVFMNLDATIDKAIGFIEQAAKKGIHFLVFPEVFVPGYPYWTLCYPPLEIIEANAAYHDASVEVPGPEISRIQDACKRTGVAVALGISERLVNARTCFNSQVFIDSDGTILGVHRKLQPTYAERLVWGQGGGATLRVFDSKVGRVGGLCCWEHTMNIARQELIAQNEQIHAAAWPGAWPSATSPLGKLGDTQIDALMKAHALTAQCFVISAGNPVDKATLEWMEAHLGPQKHAILGGGWTAIIHPFNNYLDGPHTGLEEKLVMAEIDLDDIKTVKVWVEGVGHYSRPEVLRFQVDHRPIWRDEHLRSIPADTIPAEPIEQEQASSPQGPVRLV